MATKPKAKSASAKLAGGAGKSKVKSASSHDVFMDVAKEVENLPQEKAFAMVRDLSEGAESTLFRLGGVLAHIQSKASAEGGEAWLNGKESFRELIETEFGLHYRKAMYFIQIYTDLVEKQIPWALVSGMGWSKLKELTKILTPKNAESWGKKAEKMTVFQIQEAVKKILKPGSDAKDSEVSSLTFKVHGDQKKAIRDALDKAKEETKTEYDSVALFNISQGYLGNSVTIETVGGESKKSGKPLSEKAQKKADKEALAALMEKVGVDVVLEAFGDTFPKVDIEVKM
jgi:hypothetical protein